MYRRSFEMHLLGLSGKRFALLETNQNNGAPEAPLLPTNLARNCQGTAIAVNAAVAGSPELGVNVRTQAFTAPAVLLKVPVAV